MPNHIRTTIKPSKDFEKITEKVVSKIEGKEDEFFFDFEKIIPVPDDIFRGDLTQEMELKHGEKTWYKWNISHWGAKWNSYDFDPYAKYDEKFSFQTAWASPEPVIIALSEMFPDVEFEVKYADEDIGSNLGWYKILNGEIFWEYEFTGKMSVEDEKTLFALQLRRE